MNGVPRFRRSLRGADRPRRADSDGNPLCRECEGPVSRPRRTFCSDACVQALRVRTSPSAAREGVFERDRGVCARCRIDTLDLLRRLRNLARRRARPEVLAEARQLALGFEAAIEVGSGSRVLRIRRTLWQADHILPVAEGGGGCSLDNLRTLCLPCHRTVTAELAERLRRIARDGKGDAVSLFLETEAEP